MGTRTPPLSSSIDPSETHGKEGNIKYLMVEDQQNGQPKSRKAYFHQPVAGARSEYNHWSQPLSYENCNAWERQEGWQTIEIDAPPGVEYIKENLKLDTFPVIKIGRFDEKIASINKGDDKKWLMEYLGVNIEQQVHGGATGIYLRGKIGRPKQVHHDFNSDIQRLKRAKRQLVIIKLYITFEMTKPEQMDRLYEETLAHCQLQHPNIVDTYSVRFRVNKARLNAQGEINAIDGRTDLHSYILMEYSEIGSMAMLMQKLLDTRQEFAYYFLYLQDMIAGLTYLHSTGRAHREFNYTNCLAVQAHRGFKFKEEIWTDNPPLGNCIIKICDFAFTKQFDQRTEQELMRNWQSMDVMDLARNILWHGFRYIKPLDRRLTAELFELVEKVTDQTNNVQRLGNLQCLLMKKEDEGKNVRDFMNDAAAKRTTRTLKVLPGGKK